MYICLTLTLQIPTHTQGGIDGSSGIPLLEEETETKPEIRNEALEVCHPLVTVCMYTVHLTLTLQVPTHTQGGIDGRSGIPLDSHEMTETHTQGAGDGGSGAPQHNQETAPETKSAAPLQVCAHAV